MERKRKNLTTHGRKKMNRTIPICLLFILLVVSSVQLVFADAPLSVSFDPNPIQPPYYEPPSPPSNIPPVANITGSRIGYVNQSLIFSAQYSYDPDGIIIEYRWDFENDGLFDTEWTKEILSTHSYSNPGNYTIKLQVKDDDQATGITQLFITIIRLTPPLQLPIAHAHGPYQAYTNQTFTFYSNDSYDPDGIIVNYNWDFGDKTFSYEQNPVHVYTQPGNYIAILTVRDNDNLSNIALASVYIREHKESVAPDNSQSTPPIIPFIIILCIFLIILFANLFNLLTTPTKDHILSFKKQNMKNRREGKIGNRPLELKKKTKIIKPTPFMETLKQKPHSCKPSGKSVFFDTSDEKLGDIIEIIRNENNQIIGYKVKGNKSEKVLQLFAERCIQQDDELIKSINYAFVLDKMVQDNIHVLKEQHILIEDILKDLQIKKEENMISQEQYLQMALQYHQMLERIDQNIKKYQNIAKRFPHPSSGKLNKLHK